MVLKGETLASGAPRVCEKCSVEVELEVCSSGGGYYIGTWCDCGPYTRESGYFSTYEEAETHLENNTWEAR